MYSIKLRAFLHLFPYEHAAISHEELENVIIIVNITQVVTVASNSLCNHQQENSLALYFFHYINVLYNKPMEVAIYASSTVRGLRSLCISQKCNYATSDLPTE